MSTIFEDAKTAWLDLVTHHKKRQKGLAITTLNPDAGNVECNINLFNAMQPSSAATPDAVNGAVATGDSIGEALTKPSHPDKLITLSYTNLPVEVPINDFDQYPLSTKIAGTGAFKTITMNYEYEVHQSDVIDLFETTTEVLDYIDYSDLTKDEITEVLYDKFDELLSEFMPIVLDAFKEQAANEAEHNYIDPDEAEMFDYTVTVNDSADTLDDKFDMSMRTIL